MILKTNPHKYLKNLRDVFESDDNLYLVFDKSHGTSLLSSIELLSVYTETTAKILMRSLLEAISHLHNNGFIHRDIRLQDLSVK